jgi:hypothetical protein
MVKITLSSQSEIAWLRSLTGIGRIRSNRRTWEWVVRDKTETAWILRMIKPYTHGKKKQVRMALRILGSATDTAEKMHALARLADALAAFNVRSKNRRKNYAAVIQGIISRND